MNNLIVTSFCFLENWDSGNLKSKNNAEIYIKNAFVCMKSAKRSNPDSRCIFFVNSDIPNHYKELFNKNNIEVFVLPFEHFVFDENYKWSLAFYKLNVLAFLNTCDWQFNKIILLDNDIYVKTSLSNIFRDSDEYILLLDLCRRLNSPEYEVFYEDLKQIYGDNAFPITLFGGEFIAISKTNLKLFIDECFKVYKKLREENIRVKSGDEFILSVVAHENRELILNAGNYIGRYWTGMYRFNSENSGYNYVRLLHCPSEKSFGFLKLFKILKKGKKIPPKKVYKLLHIYHGHIHIPTILWFIKTKQSKNNEKVH